MREKVVVPFSGPETGTAPLTWGQKAVWQDMQATGESLSLAGIHELPAGTTVADVAAALASLIGRHPALRMRLGTAAPGRPCQVVSGSGEVAFDIVTIPDDAAGAADFALALMHEQQIAPFDLHREWPVRLAVIRHRDALRYQICTVSHLVADGVSMAMLLAELKPGGAPDCRAAPPGAASILDIARREHTEPLRRISHRAMRYWESQLLSAPPLTFGEAAGRPGRLGHRYWHGQFSSPAAYLSMLAIAERTGTNASGVMLALIATAIARAAGVNPLTVKIIVSNRFRPGFADVIAPISQKSVVTVDLARVSIDEAAARIQRATLAAAMYGYYDPEQLGEVTAGIASKRGQPPQITCMVNDARVASTLPAGRPGSRAPVTREQIREKLPETVLTWDGTLENFPDHAWITVLDRPETVWLQVIFDLACFTEAQAEALLRSVEEMAVEAAFDPEAPTRIARHSIS